MAAEDPMTVVDGGYGAADYAAESTSMEHACRNNNVNHWTSHMMMMMIVIIIAMADNSTLVPPIPNVTM